jgi:hypothetical protein
MFPLCSEAIRMSALAAPDLRGPMIVIACQRSYCEVLMEPRPALCELSLATMPNAELRAPWNDFVTHVIAHEHGLEDDDPLLTVLVTALSRLIPQEAAPVTPQLEAVDPEVATLVTFDHEGSAYWLAATNPQGRSFGPFELPLSPTSTELEGFLEEAMRSNESDQVMIRVTPIITLDLVEALMTALRAQGAARIGFERVEEL